MDMSKTILANVDGFTPVIDEIVKDVGLMSAVVFGRMWRFCQMKDGVCNASLEKIAEEIGIDRATVMRHAKALCDAGYLKDLTPGLRNHPHTYADTGKVMLRLNWGVAQNNSKKTDVADSNATVAQRNVTVAESKLKRDSKRDSKKVKEGATPRANDFRSNVLFREVTERYPAKANWHTVLGFVSDVEKRLGREATREDLFPFYEAWCGMGWRSDSINWLEYAVKGVLPGKQNSQKPTENKTMNAVRQYLSSIESYEVVNG
jgi:DNA-binding Lrp family transcriptional regulator